MTALRNLAELAEQAGLEFIVCGGHTVNAYQVIRKTGDIDLVVRERDASRWKERLTGLGYAVFHESGAFLQLRPPSPAAWPVDLLFVDDGTFDTLRRASTSRSRLGRPRGRSLPQPVRPIRRRTRPGKD